MRNEALVDRNNLVRTPCAKTDTTMCIERDAYGRAVSGCADAIVLHRIRDHLVTQLGATDSSKRLCSDSRFGRELGRDVEVLPPTSAALPGKPARWIDPLVGRIENFDDPRAREILASGGEFDVDGFPGQCAVDEDHFSTRQARNCVAAGDEIADNHFHTPTVRFTPERTEFL